MVKALVISNNIGFIQKLLHEINAQDLDIKITEIAENKAQIEENLSKLDLDIIFIDEAMKNNYDKIFLQKYKEIIISLSYSDTLNLINEITLNEICNLIERNDFDKRKERIIKELEYIGYKFKYKGTHYLVDTILQMYSKQNSMVDNLQTSIYPIIAKKYNKTIHNVKSSINKATECMYCECDGAKIENYFHFNYDTKPTVKQVVFTVINKI